MTLLITLFFAPFNSLETFEVAACFKSAAKEELINKAVAAKVDNKILLFINLNSIREMFLNYNKINAYNLLKKKLNIKYF